MTTTRRAMVRRPATGVVAALVLVLAACTSGGSGSSSSSREPIEGGVLRLGLEQVGQWRPLDARAVPQSELVVADLLFDGLTRWDAEAEVAVPALADEWTVDATGLAWTFHLRPGATFSDGSALTAADVVATLQAAAAADASLLPSFSAASAVAADQVRIDLSAPLASLPEVLSVPRLGVVPAAAVGTAVGEAAALPATSGPFRVDPAVAPTAALVTLVRAEGATARLDGVELHLFADETAAYDSYRVGDVGWALVPSDVDPADATDVEGAPLPAELFYGMNLADPSLADVRFREAIVRAVDPEAISAAAYSSGLEPLAGVVVDGVAGHQDDACGGRCSYDPEASRALVAEVFGAEAPPALAIDFDEGVTERVVAQTIADQLAAVGITATLRPHAPEEYATFVASGGAQLFRLGWTGAFPSAGAYLEPLFRSTSADDVTNLADPAVDAVLDQARTEADPGERGERYAEAERLVMAKLPLVPIGQYQSRWVTAVGVEGLALDITGSFDIAEVWLSR